MELWARGVRVLWRIGNPIEDVSARGAPGELSPGFSLGDCVFWRVRSEGPGQSAHTGRQDLRCRTDF
jgi:hypothetical protein